MVWGIKDEYFEKVYPQQQIKTLTLRFKSPTSKQFDQYARRKGYNPAWSMDGRWQKATVIFGNASDKRKFFSGWANESMEDSDKHQKFLALR